MFSSIEKTYGKPVATSMDLLASLGAMKHMGYVQVLKNDHGLGHGHANALVAAYLVEK